MALSCPKNTSFFGEFHGKMQKMQKSPTAVGRGFLTKEEYVLVEELFVVVDDVVDDVVDGGCAADDER